MRRIGGSNIAGICGCSPWSTPLDEYMKITGQTTVPDNSAMYWGRALEPIIRRKYEEETGRDVIFSKDPNKLGLEAVHPEHPFMVGSLDGMTTDERVLEIKTARVKWEDGVPEHYQCQVQYYMACTGMKVADVAVLFGSNGFNFEIYEIPRDEELISIMTHIAVMFWNNNVLPMEPPDCVTPADRNIRWSRSVSNAVEDLSAQKIIERVKALRLGLSAMEAEKDELEAAIKDIMKDNDTLTVDGKAVATWKMAKGSTIFNKDQFAKAHPALYREFTTNKPGSRRFLIK
jgi:putative phage-type endonuclease